MGGIDNTFFDLGRLDRLARQDTSIHILDPRAKIVTTMAFLVCVVSFGKYEVSALLPFAIYPIYLAGVGRIPFPYLGWRVLTLAPFAILVGIFNPLLDRDVAFQLGSFEISGGWVSFTSILVRFALTVGTAIVLIAVTSFDGLCHGLRRLGVPRIFTIQLLFLYRYIFVLADEALRLIRARDLRSFGKKGRGIRIYGSLVGQLLLRTLERARRIHMAMSCRGFTGEMHLLRDLRIGAREISFTLVWCLSFLILKSWNLPLLLGGFVTGVFQ